MSEELMFMVRVKLPTASHQGNLYQSELEKFNSDYEKSYKSSVFAAKPPGFEIKWPRNGEKWPIDSEGYSFMPLYISDRKEVHLHYVEKVFELQKELDRIKGELRKLI